MGAFDHYLQGETDYIFTTTITILPSIDVHLCQAVIFRLTVDLISLMISLMSAELMVSMEPRANRVSLNERRLSTS